MHYIQPYLSLPKLRLLKDFFKLLWTCLYCEQFGYSDVWCVCVCVDMWQLLAHVLHSIQVDVPAGGSFIFEGGSKFLHEDRLLHPERGCLHPY